MPASVPAPALDLSQAVVIITGSTRGIGRALAEAFAAKGAAVVVNGRDAAAVESLERELRAAGARVRGVAANVAEPEGASRLIEAALQSFGRIDVLINNAAVIGPPKRPIWDVEPSEWEAVLRVNVSAGFFCARETARWAIRAGSPVRIVNVSSGVVHSGAPLLGAYSVSKAAQQGLTTALTADAELLSPLVSAVSVEPRSVATAMTRSYFSHTEYALMEPAESVVPVFLYAATAPADAVAGKHLLEPAFAQDPGAEVVLNSPFATAPDLRPVPAYRWPPAGTPPEAEAGEYLHLLQNPRHRAAVGLSLAERVRGPELHRYPDPSYADLRARISEYTGLPPEWIRVGAGASQLIDRALRLFCQPYDSILVTKPTWSLFFGLALRYRLRMTEVACLGSVAGKDLRHDLTGLLNAVGRRTRLVYLVNPCNPTGSMLEKAALLAFVEALPAHVTLLLDEAYVEYSEPERRVAIPALLAAARCRLVVLRTFSKFFALSGFRVGYALGKPEVVRHLDRIDLNFGVANASQFAACICLGDALSMTTTYVENARERTRLQAGLDALGLANMPSQANFVLVHCPVDPARMRADLAKEGLHLPNVDVFLGSYALLAVGTPEHNARVLGYLGAH
jgi:histidinol-phosphate aminotransferase